MTRWLKTFCRPLLLSALTLSLLLPAAANAEFLSSHASLVLAVSPERPIALEEMRLTVIVSDRNRQPVANATVQVRADMVAAGMAGMQHGSGSAPVTAKPGDRPGEYIATLKLTDPGDWKITAASGDSIGELKVTAVSPGAAKSVAASAAKAQTAPPAWVKVASDSAKASSMETVHASYLDLTGNIGDLRSRVEQWKRGDADSRKIAGEKLDRIQAVLGSVTWPIVMAKAVLTTANAVAPTSKALSNSDVVAAETAAKAIGDASHDVIHAFYGDWLSSVEGTRFSPMAPHAIYLDLSLNIADLRDRIGQWEKGDEGSLNIAKEKAERIDVLIPHLVPYGVLLNPVQTLDKRLPAVAAALEKGNVAAAQQALKPVAEASHDLTHDFYKWVEVAGGGNDAACVLASHRDLTLNIADLRARIAQWQLGDQASIDSAVEKLERVDAVLAHPTWPGEMAKAVGKTEIAAKAMAKALNDRDVAAAGDASRALGDGSYDVTHDYFVNWLPNVRLGADEGQIATGQGKRVTNGHDDGHGASEEPAGPNYYFVGSMLGAVVITVLMVPILRRRDLRAPRREAA